MTSYDKDAALWDELARSDPGWAVCSTPELRGAGLPPAFWQSGEDEVAGILAGLEGAGLSVPRRSALDFGCGIGRLTRPLALQFERAVGVDVSETMVRRATELHADLANCRFHHNPGADLRAFESGSVDLVLSLIALQHIRSAAAIRRFLEEFVRLLAPDGVAVVQVPHAVPARVRWHPARVAVRAAGPRLVRRLPRLAGYAMTLTPVPAERVAESVASAGGTVLHRIPDNRVGSESITSYSYVIARRR